MNNKNKLITFFIFISILTFSIVNIKNSEKTKFYIFTSKIEEISLGNLITITFISGFTLSSILRLVSKNNFQESLENSYIKDEDMENSEENNINEEFKFDRPPERDIRESQPTISVNYRFIDQENNSYSSKNTQNINNNFNNEDKDWLNYDDEW